MNPNSIPVAPESLRGPITVFTPYFAARTPERQAELDLCLRRNAECAAITRLVLLIDDGHVPPVSHPKIEIRHIDGRPTYRQWIEMSQDLSPGEISLLANTDIWFDDSIRWLQKALGEPCRFLALTRYEQLGDRLEAHPNPRWSQDTWGFRVGTALPAPLLKALDIPLGVPRCDNKIAYLFAVHGWTVHNPLSHVRSVHVHETQQRSYDKKADLTVLGGVAYVHPSASVDAPSELEYDVWSINTHLVKSVKLNRSIDNWRKEAAAPTPADVSAPACQAVKSIPDIDRAIREGAVRFDLQGRFRLYDLDGRTMAVDSFSAADAHWIDGLPAAAPGTGLPDPVALLTAWVPPVLDTAPIRIRERPLDKADCHFWQYPAATERQACENHRGLSRGSNIDAANRRVHVYLGLPWATYIDKKNLPEDVPHLIGLRIAGLRDLAKRLGYELRVHTVCQQIHWRRMIDTFSSIGVTDLHLSHDEDVIAAESAGWPFRIHAWTLFAPNIEVPERRVGLDIGRPLEKKRFLASFIGAHMPHYRTDVRVKLFEAVKAANRDDLIVDLGNEWHFNKVVYKEQVQHKPLAATEASAVQEAAERYNMLLSDSVFSLCPEGAGPNTLRLWESMAIGAIPVVLADGWHFPTGIRGLEQPETFCLFVAHRDVGDIVRILDAVPHEQRRRMQAQAIRAYAAARDARCF